jgi:2-methylcitrate dehydratase PrpD
MRVIPRGECMSVVAELVGNVLETTFERFDPSEVDRARSKLIDVVGCIIGGANAPGCSMLLGQVEEWGGNEEGTILVHGIKVPLHNAALMNSVMARSYDFEPTGPLVDGKKHSGTFERYYSSYGYHGVSAKGCQWQGSSHVTYRWG